MDAHVEPNVSAYRRNPRKLLARLGYLERLILIYSSKHSRTFMASDIVVMYGLKNLNGNANKRVHDAIKRLLRRGFIKKVDRGTYQLILDITPDLLGEHKENLCSHRPLPVDGSVGNCVGKHCFMDGLNTVRIHVVGVGGYLDLYYELLIINHFSRIAVREVESYLVRLGVSRKAIREFRKNVFCYVPSRVVVGGHGRYKCRGKHLMPFFMGFLYEYGVDIVANMPLPKMFIKVYTDNLDYPINPMLKSSS